MSCPQPKGRKAAGVKSFRLSFGNEPESSVLAGIEGTLPIVDLGHDTTEATNVDRSFWNFSFQPSVVQKGQDFLGFSHCENRNEDGSPALKCLANSSKKAFLEKSTILAWNGSLRASGCFHDQGIEGSCGMLAGEHEGLSLQIEVPGIEGAVFFGANFCHDGSGDVACVVQNEFKCGGVDPNGAVQAGKFPSDCAVVDRTVGIEGIVGATEFAALTSHDVDRIVKKGFG